MASAQNRYEQILRWSMDILGISESLKWKISVAVGIQFVISLAQATLPFVVSGIVRYGVMIALFACACIAFVNTLLIAKDDIITPLTQLDVAANDIANGNLETDLPDPDQEDELGDLIDSFHQMNSYLRTVERQANALANHDFEADVFEEDVPGQFGKLLARMTDGIRSYIERVNHDRDRFQLLNHLVSHDIPNLLNVLIGRGELLEEELDDSSQRQHLDVMLEQAAQIQDTTQTVHQLSTTDTAGEIDLTTVLQETVAHANESFPEAEVETTELPERASVYGNDLLQSVFNNLVTNAIEHNDSPQKRVGVSAFKTHEEVVVRVADNGSGIPDEEKDGFFDDIDPKSGLGLVYTVTKRFDGEIRITDNEPVGTIFSVRLPKYQETTQREQSTSAITGRPYTPAE